MSADNKRLDVGYDIPALAKVYDWFNVMDYDYHGAWENFTGPNTPLYGRHEEDDINHPGHRFNLNDSISYYLNHGVPKEQIVVGMATFGHSWSTMRLCRHLTMTPCPGCQERHLMGGQLSLMAA